MTFEQLMREHDEIDAHTRRLEECCAVQAPAIAEVVAARGALRIALEEHLAHEDEALFGRLMTANRASAEAVHAFAAEFGQLRADWGAYLSDWSAAWLADDWDGFRQETAALMSRMRDRTRQETELLYPLALRTAAIGLRAA
uniref:hemerythrin domain-containing protein n=1 Tax=Sphingomonas bacterium TaxID=1895847 RepID=UPI00261912CD|nr:hemerythrin domain-containing protein [Sphingomonas bacterium]